MKLPQLKIGSLMPRFPIIQGGMAVRVSTAPLAAAVARAGGVGLIAATGMEPDELRAEIKQARSLADGGIVGINVMFAIRNFAELVRAAFEEKIDVVFSGAGFSRDIFGWAKEANIPVVSIVSTSKLALIAEKYGAAAVVAEGVEAGGHLGTTNSTAEILPEIVKKVKIPVIAAGGIVDGIGMAKMLKLGASGVQMATRFVLSQECTVAKSFKEMYLKAKKEDVVLVESPVGMPGRALRNEFITQMLQDAAGNPDKCRGCLKACTKKYCIMDALENARTGAVHQGLVFCGQNVTQIKEILTVDEIFKNIIAQVEAVAT